MEDLVVVDLCPDLKGEELPSCEADVGCSELPRERNGLARGGIVSLGVRIFAKILIPIKWPKSIDDVWKANIPHTHLATENLMKSVNRKLKDEIAKLNDQLQDQISVSSSSCLNARIKAWCFGDKEAPLPK
ncbi:putative methyltransferase PMT8 [Morus notabilis]|uniref:Putative methyltransferase PMT8 n=1 Tax=Morus notabilis TaxID=981085 RepID=W9R9A1_9ROSA|nr:putative methyltransferase PMT8 [Morus notabilis]